jgi:peptidylprolyl isomerase/peptidyl-prolyl cis-trans isomerase C
MKKIKVSHILVDKEFEAQDLLRALREGKSFEHLAIRYSKCSSAKEGGFLGEIAIDRLDENFTEAALKLNLEETSSKPVRTRFGYHIIRHEK